MKKVLAIIAVVVLVMGGVALAGVKGTYHDLSGGTGQICVACHTPHGGLTNSYGPLWNRNVNLSTVTFNGYTSATFDMGPATMPPGPQSLACLTCHSGVTSGLINYPGHGSPVDNTYDVDANRFSAYSLIGSDLSNDHPVGFTYNPGADNQVNNFPAIVNGAIPSTNSPGKSYPLFNNNNGNNQFECATCHDVHNIANPNPQPVYFLRANNLGSNMCGDCHTAKF